MTQKIEVISLDTGSYVVSDGGKIAKHFGLDTPWEMIAPTRDHIPSRLQSMEKLIAAFDSMASEAFSPSAGKRRRKKKASKKTAARKGTKKKATTKKKAKKKVAKKTTKKATTKKAKAAKKTATKKASKKTATPKKGSVRELVGNKLLGAHVARLEKAGITTVNALTKKSRAQLLKVQGVGAKMVDTIEVCLKTQNMQLAT